VPPSFTDKETRPYQGRVMPFHHRGLRNDWIMTRTHRPKQVIFSTAFVLLDNKNM